MFQRVKLSRGFRGRAGSIVLVQRLVPPYLVTYVLYAQTFIHSSIHTCIHTYIHMYIRSFIPTYTRDRYIHTYIHTYIRTCANVEQMQSKAAKSEGCHDARSITASWMPCNRHFSPRPFEPPVGEHSYMLSARSSKAKVSG